jgi:hypothetical protein
MNIQLIKYFLATSWLSRILFACATSDGSFGKNSLGNQVHLEHPSGGIQATMSTLTDRAI